MPTIKSLLKALVETRTTPTEASHAAFPQSYPLTLNIITLSSNSGAQEGSYLAPSDGYICAQSKPNNNGVLQCAAWGSVETNFYMENTSLQATIFRPVAKGTYVWYCISNCIYLKFVPAILGGGKVLYKQCCNLLERGALWLRLSSCSKHSNRLSLTLRKLGSNHRLLLERNIPVWESLDNHRSASPRRLMGTLCFWYGISHMRKFGIPVTMTCQMVRDGASLLETICEFVSPFERGIQFTACTKVLTRFRQLGESRSTPTGLNFSFGGAA